MKRPRRRLQAMAPLMQLKSQMKINKMEIEQTTADPASAASGARSTQARLNATPAVEAEMGDMMRDYGNMKKEYAELLAKKQESALATSLERQQQGAQFRIVDPPSLAGQAVFPRSLQVLAGRHRRRIGAGGAVWIRVRSSG